MTTGTSICPLGESVVPGMKNASAALTMMTAVAPAAREFEALVVKVQLPLMTTTAPPASMFCRGWQASMGDAIVTRSQWMGLEDDGGGGGQEEKFEM